MGDENTSDKPREEALERTRMPWEEITETERIERLRYIIKQEQNRNGELSQEISELRDLIRRHRHGDDHEVLVSANMVKSWTLRAGCCESAGPNHKPWF